MKSSLRDHHHRALRSAIGAGHTGIGRGLAVALTLALVQIPQSARAEGADEAQPAGDASAEGASEEPERDANLDQAMRAYNRGKQNYNLAQYEAALADFQEAASLYASPDFQYNIGLCYEKLGKYEEAILAFVTYLKTKPGAEDRPNVENRIKELREKIEQQKQEEADAKARAEEDARNRNQPVQPTQPVDEGPENPGRGLVIAGAALIAAGGAVALGGGVGFGVLASQRNNSLNDVQIGGNPDMLTFADAQNLETEGQRFETIQIGMAAGGAVVAVTGTVLLALGLKKRKAAVEPSAWLSPSMAGLSFRGRF